MNGWQTRANSIPTKEGLTARNEVIKDESKSKQQLLNELNELRKDFQAMYNQKIVPVPAQGEHFLSETLQTRLLTEAAVVRLLDSLRASPFSPQGSHSLWRQEGTEYRLIEIISNPHFDAELQFTKGKLVGEIFPSYASEQVTKLFQTATIANAITPQAMLNIRQGYVLSSRVSPITEGLYLLQMSVSVHDPTLASSQIDPQVLLDFFDHIKLPIALWKKQPSETGLTSPSAELLTPPTQPNLSQTNSQNTRPNHSNVNFDNNMKNKIITKPQGTSVAAENPPMINTALNLSSQNTPGVGLNISQVQTHTSSPRVRSSSPLSSEKSSPRPSINNDMQLENDNNNSYNLANENNNNNTNESNKNINNNFNENNNNNTNRSNKNNNENYNNNNNTNTNNLNNNCNPLSEYYFLASNFASKNLRRSSVPPYNFSFPQVVGAGYRPEMWQLFNSAKCLEPIEFINCEFSNTLYNPIVSVTNLYKVNSGSDHYFFTTVVPITTEIVEKYQDILKKSVENIDDDVKTPNVPFFRNNLPPIQPKRFKAEAVPCLSHENPSKIVEPSPNRDF